MSLSEHISYYFSRTQHFNPRQFSFLKSDLYSSWAKLPFSSPRLMSSLPFLFSVAHFSLLSSLAGHWHRGSGAQGRRCAGLAGRRWVGPVGRWRARGWRRAGLAGLQRARAQGWQGSDALPQGTSPISFKCETQQKRRHVLCLSQMRLQVCHFVRKIQLRRTRTKNGDAQITRLRHHVLHYSHSRCVHERVFD
jgi:hypothetical protein